MSLETVIELGRLRAHQLVQVRSERVWRQLEPSLCFTSLSAHFGTGAPRDLQHRGVLAERMDKESSDSAVSRMKDCVFEEPLAESAPARLWQNRDAEFRHQRSSRLAWFHGMCQMRHCNQRETAVE